MMHDAPVLVSEQGNVLILCLNRPEKLNAISGEMLEILTAQIGRFAVEPHLRVLLIRATGRYFSAGVDLNGAMAPPADIDRPAQFRQWFRDSPNSLHIVGDRIEKIEKPVVIAHQGPCLGGALELSLSCDFRLAASSARYGLPEIAMGVIPVSGGISRLTRLIGPHWARWLVMTGRQISADKAGSIGLVHEVYPDEAFDAEVLALCADLARQSPEALGGAKLAIELSADLDRAQGRAMELSIASGVYFGAEAQEKVAEWKARFADQGKARPEQG